MTHQFVTVPLPGSVFLQYCVILSPCLGTRHATIKNVQSISGCSINIQLKTSAYGNSIKTTKRNHPLTKNASLTFFKAQKKDK